MLVLGPYQKKKKCGKVVGSVGKVVESEIDFVLARGPLVENMNFLVGEMTFANCHKPIWLEFSPPENPGPQGTGAKDKKMGLWAQQESGDGCTKPQSDTQEMGCSGRPQGWEDFDSSQG